VGPAIAAVHFWRRIRLIGETGARTPVPGGGGGAGMAKAGGVLALPGFHRCRIETDRPRSGVSRVGGGGPCGTETRPGVKRRGELT